VVFRLDPQPTLILFGVDNRADRTGRDAVPVVAVTDKAVVQEVLERALEGSGLHNVAAIVTNGEHAGVSREAAIP
jgi:hypothetical protein